MPKDELVGNTTDLAEERVLAGTREKKERAYGLWKDGQ